MVPLSLFREATRCTGGAPDVLKPWFSADGSVISKNSRLEGELEPKTRLFINLNQDCEPRETAGVTGPLKQPRRLEWQQSRLAVRSGDLRRWIRPSSAKLRARAERPATAADGRAARAANTLSGRGRMFRPRNA